MDTVDSADGGVGATTGTVDGQGSSHRPQPAGAGPRHPRQHPRQRRAHDDVRALLHPRRRPARRPRSAWPCRWPPLVGLLVQVPIGHLGDVRGPRELLRLLMIGAGVASLGPAADRRHLAAGAGARRPGGLRPGRQRGAQRPHRPARRGRPRRSGSRRTCARSPTSASPSGALLGGLALWVDRPWAYLAVFALNARHLRARRDGGRSPAAHRARAGPGGGAATAAGACATCPYVVVTAPDRDLRDPLPRDGARRCRCGWRPAPSRAEVARGRRPADQHRRGGAVPGPALARQRRRSCRRRGRCSWARGGSPAASP